MLGFSECYGIRGLFQRLELPTLRKEPQMVENPIWKWLNQNRLEADFFLCVIRYL